MKIGILRRLAIATTEASRSRFRRRALFGTQRLEPQVFLRVDCQVPRAFAGAHVAERVLALVDRFRLELDILGHAEFDQPHDRG